MTRAALAALVLLAGCAPTIPDNTYFCSTDGDCPPNFSCIGGRCFNGCTEDCGVLRANCGLIDNGCGVMVDCGGCASGVCGGGGIPNICACEPRTCQIGFDCGMVDNGCGSAIDCGDCFQGFTCDGGVCGCGGVVDCTGYCGAVPDGCGGLVLCPDCPEGENCGGGGPNMCGSGTCVPASCGPDQCDTISDGCGEVIDCGPCDPPDTCGVAGPNLCGCVPVTCEQGYECGPLFDPCSQTITDCGPCPEGEVCGGAGIDNFCGCPPHTCDGLCGSVADPCLGTVMLCDDCSGGATCENNVCVCTPDRADAAGGNELPMDAEPLGRLTAGSTVNYNEFGIHQADDVDWFGWTLGAVAGGSSYVFQFTLGGIPSDANYDVRLRPTCPDSTATVSCTRGMLFGPPFECRSNLPGNADEVIEMRVSGCTVTGLLARVSATTFGESCSTYDMSVGFSANSTTTPDGGMP